MQRSFKVQVDVECHRNDNFSAPEGDWVAKVFFNRSPVVNDQHCRSQAEAILAVESGLDKLGDEILGRWKSWLAQTKASLLPSQPK